MIYKRLTRYFVCVQMPSKVILMFTNALPAETDPPPLLIGFVSECGYCPRASEQTRNRISPYHKPNTAAMTE